MLKGAAEIFFALGLLLLSCLASKSQSFQQSWLTDLGCCEQLAAVSKCKLFQESSQRGERVVAVLPDLARKKQC